MKKLYFLCVFLSLFTLPFCLNAQNITWEKLNGPSGGNGWVYEGKNGYLIMVSNGGLGYRSNDGGLFWEEIVPPPVNNPRGIVVGADKNLYSGDLNIYQSTDNGESWTLISNIFPRTIFALPGGELLIGRFYSEIHRSIDNGQTWQLVANDVQSNGSRSFAYNALTGDVYTWDNNIPASETGKLWRSSDQGQSWHIVLEATGLASQVAFSPNGAIFVGGRGGLWRSFDNGLTWTSLPTPVPGYTSPVSVWVTPSGRLLTHQYYLSKYSDNNGNTWHQLEDEWGNFYEDISGTPDGKIFASRRGKTLYRSEDNGVSWHFAAHNIFYASVHKTIHIDPLRILALTDSGLFYTNDGGNSWELIWDEMIDRGYLLSSVMVSPDGSWYLWNGIKHLIRFTDEGQTHTVAPIPNTPGAGPFTGMWCSPVSSVIFLATSENFYMSADGGQTWILQHSDLPVTWWHPILPLPDGALLHLQPSGVFRSTDNGQNWSLISNKQFSAPKSFLAPNGLLYVLENQQTLFISPDGGLTWDSIALSIEIDRDDLMVNNEGHIFLCNYFGPEMVNRSVDGGLTFNNVDPEEYFLLTPFPMSMGASQQLYLAGSGEGLYRSVLPTTGVQLLTGHLWHDLDMDCAYVQPDSLWPGQLAIASNGNETFYGYANHLGRYLLPVTGGDYDISGIQLSDYWFSCNAEVTIANTPQTGIVDSVDIGIQIITECPMATVSVSAPFLRRCFESTVYVRYKNNGTVVATDAYVTITLDDFLEFNDASLPVSAQSGNTYTFLLGNLGVGAMGTLTMQVTPSCDAELGAFHCLEAHIYPDELCPELNTPHIVTDAICLGDSIRLIINNIGAAGMAEPLNWFAIGSDFLPVLLLETIADGSFLLDAGASFSTTIASGYATIDFHARQAPEYPFNVISTTTIQGCGVAQGDPPLNIFSQDDTGPFTDVLCQRNIGAYDPNDKQGLPAGITDRGYIEHGQQLTYLIRFQNTGTDTAMNVSIRDTLPEALDPASVKLLNASHECELRMMPNGSLLFVFERIMLPDSNINEAASHGFVQFSVQQKPDVPTGMVIQNKAGIYFDFNAPVITNQTLHTVGIPVITDIKEPASQGRQTIVRAMPNPFTESFTITLLHAIPDQELRVLLMDNHGKMISEQAFNDRSVNIPRGNLPQGVYHFLVVNGNGKRIGNGTVVAQ